MVDGGVGADQGLDLPAVPLLEEVAHGLDVSFGVGERGEATLGVGRTNPDEQGEAGPECPAQNMCEVAAH